MIRINLLGGEKQKAARRAPAFDIGKRITLACSLLLGLTAAGVGWWYWSLRTEAETVEAEIAAAHQEVARLRPIIAEVSTFEARRQQLQQRVQLIEQLRKGQGLPVQMLDQVSRSLPEMLWLTTMEQEGADLTMEGRSTTLVALSDFVGNLGTSDFFTKPIEIVNSQLEARAGQQTGPELIKFTVKAQLANAPAAAAGAGKK